MRIVLTIAVFLLTLSLNAQAVDKKSTVTEELALPIKTETVAPHTAKDIFVEGTITSPEDQGFTKKTVNGKEVYYKESPGIMIEYQPKSN